MKNYNIEQMRMLQVLSIQQREIPVSLGDLANPDFQELVNDNIIEFNNNRYVARIHVNALQQVKEFFDGLARE